MKKLRWPACLLSLLLLVGSLPATAFAEQPDDAVGDQKNGAATVYVGGQAMTAGASAESWYADGQVVASEPASYSAHLYLDAANNGALTLEIRDLTVSGTEDDAASRGAGIYTTQALTIRYSGENTVTASTAFDYDAAPGVSFRSCDISYGIFAGGLVLIGETGASLNVTAADVKGSSYGICSDGALTVQGGTIRSRAGNTIDIRADWNFSSVGLYAQGDMLPAGGADIFAAGGNAYAGSYQTSRSAGVMSRGDITIEGCTVEAVSEQAFDLDAGVPSNCNYMRYSRGLYAQGGDITIAGGTVTADGGRGLVSAGIDCDWGLTVKNDAKVYATAGEAKVYSYGIKVWNDYHQSGSAQVYAKAVNTTGVYTGALGTRAPRSYGFYMGDSYYEQAGNANTFTITGGIFEAQSLADAGSTTLPSAGTGSLGGEENALKFFDVRDNAATFSDSEQPNAQWYWWTLDPAHGAANKHTSPTKAYVYDDAEGNYLSKYLYIAPIGPETGDLRLTKTVSGEGVDTEKAFSFTVTLGDASINGAYGEMTFVNGVASVQVKHGQTVSATGLPAGTTYSIVETEADQGGYTTTATRDTGSIEKDVAVQAVFVNHKEKALVQVRVDKVWKLDDGGTAAGPVQAALLQNGAEYSVVTLDEANGWTYTWSGLDPQYSWTVRELNVPDGFEAAVEKVADGHFRIVNDDLPKSGPDTTPAPPAGDGSDPPPAESTALSGSSAVPATGDAGRGAWPALLLLSGAGLAALAARGKRGKKRAGP